MLHDESCDIGFLRYDVPLDAAQVMTNVPEGRTQPRVTGLPGRVWTPYLNHHAELGAVIQS